MFCNKVIVVKSMLAWVNLYYLFELYSMTYTDYHLAPPFISRLFYITLTTPITIESHRNILFMECHRMSWKYSFPYNNTECHGKGFPFQNTRRRSRLRKASTTHVVTYVRAATFCPLVRVPWFKNALCVCLV